MSENISLFSSASSVVRKSTEWFDFLLINGVFSIPGGGGTSTPLFKLGANGIILNGSGRYDLIAILYNRNQNDNGGASPIRFTRSNHGMTIDMEDMYFSTGVYYGFMTGLTNDLIIVDAPNTDTIGFSIRRAVPRQM